MFSFFSKTGRASKLNLKEIAETTLRIRERNFVYRDGLIDEAVRRASVAEGTDAVIDAIEGAFLEYEVGPRLCGYVANG